MTEEQGVFAEQIRTFNALLVLRGTGLSPAARGAAQAALIGIMRLVSAVDDGRISEDRLLEIGSALVSRVNAALLVDTTAGRA